MDSISKAIQVVGGIVLTLLLVSLIFSAYSTQQDNANQAITKTNEMNVTLLESDYTQYDGATISGSEVVNVIKRFKDQDIYVGVCVTATSGVGTSFDYYNHDATLGTNNIKDLASAKVKSNANYITPSAQFLGEVKRDDTTGAIVGITFTRQP